jgi:cell division protease FtsH
MSISPYSPLSSEVPAVDGAPLRPELADLGRLGRRAVRQVVRTARSDDTPPVARLLLEHLGPAGGTAAVAGESWPAYEHVNVQLGLEAWLARPGRKHQLVGLTNFRHRDFGLADLLSVSVRDPWGTRPGNVATVTLPTGPSGETKSCVECAIYLVDDGGRRSAILLRGPDESSGHQGVTLQVVADDETAEDIGAQVRDLALQHNVFRAQVVGFGGDMFGERRSLLTFHRRPELTRADVVLPEAVMDTVERQVVGVGRQRARLLASGQHLKRGLLLYGPPGTGKTHTIRYLLSRLTGTTVVLLSGNALHLVAQACSVARSLQPSMVVIEDVDLIAEERGMHPGQNPMLFQLLNEMDGLAEDTDVVFVLTTNRADLLEPALAARPGRVDQAVELLVPDAEARRALLHLYRGRLDLDLTGADDVIDRTEGVTASFLKELLRRAAVVAAEGDQASHQDGDAAPIAVRAEHLTAALDELLATRNAMTRALLGSGEPPS